MATAWTLENLADLVTRYRYPVGSESGLHDGIGRVLDMHRIGHSREHDLGKAFGRIDFYVPGGAIGIELKVKGSPSQTLRQLHRYALCPEIAGLILVTSRARLAFVPGELNHKPLVTASLWQGQL